MRGEVRLTASVVNGTYTLTVHDQGPGIPDTMHEQIFDIFYTTKPAGEGTGIGLAICKNIIEMHAGSLHLESRPGDTTFMVRIPVSSQRGVA